jgi:hypothetical protein
VKERALTKKEDPAIGESDAPSELDWRRVRTAMIICGLMIALYSGLLVLATIVIGLDPVRCFNLMYFRGTVGLPAAIIASVSIVALLAFGIGGDFKMSVWGLHLAGPSAPITMWIACFLSICLALWMLLPDISSNTSLPAYLAQMCGGAKQALQ